MLHSLFPVRAVDKTSCSKARVPNVACFQIWVLENPCCHGSFLHILACNSTLSRASQA